jgi:Flp pilus assembly protein TadD
MTARRISLLSLLVLLTFGCNSNSSSPRVASNDSSVHSYNPEQADNYQGASAEAYRRRGILYLRQGLPQKAKPELATAVSVNPADIEAQYMLGVCYLELGEMAGALFQEQSLRDLAQRQSDRKQADPKILPLADELHSMIDGAQAIERTDQERTQEALRDKGK